MMPFHGHGAGGDVRPQVAIVSRDAHGHTGSINKIVDHAQRMVELGWSVTLITEDADPRLTSWGIAVRKVSRFFSFSRQQRQRRFCDQAQAMCSAAHFDMVIGHGDVWTQDVLHLHNCVHLEHEKVEGRPLPPTEKMGNFHAGLLQKGHFRTVIANSYKMKADLMTRWGIPAEKIEVVHPGYHPIRFTSAARMALRPSIRQELGLEENKVVVGLITSGCFKKRGLDTLIAAIGAMEPHLRQGILVLVVGSDHQRAHWNHLATASGLNTSQMRFLAPRADVERLYHALDIYVHAGFDEFGQCAQEAICCGVPVVLSDAVGMVERLPSRDFVVPHGDTRALTAALTHLLVNPPRRV